MCKKCLCWIWVDFIHVIEILLLIHFKEYLFSLFYIKDVPNKILYKIHFYFLNKVYPHQKTK